MKRKGLKNKNHEGSMKVNMKLHIEMLLQCLEKSEL